MISTLTTLLFVLHLRTATSAPTNQSTINHIATDINPNDQPTNYIIHTQFTNHQGNVDDSSTLSNFILLSDYHTFHSNRSNSFYPNNSITYASIPAPN